MNDITDKLPTPSFVVYEDRLRRNLELLSKTAEECDINIIMAFKANALWKTFPVIREYFKASTASSLNEARLSKEYLQGDVHAYCPVYTDETFPQFLEMCSHITFNSLAQFHKFYPLIRQHNALHPDRQVSAGLRVNPQCSVIETDIYNPCVPGSRFGVDAETLDKMTGGKLPEGLDGLHFHALCESGSEDLEKVLAALEEQFSPYLLQAKWLNMGGGHLITRKGYDTALLKKLMQALHDRYPKMKIIMEPGSAFTWQTGDLITEVLDTVNNAGIDTAIIDASFACHMPDTLEMPYRPNIAEAADDDDDAAIPYRLGGNSCLSGDYCGPWRFSKPLKAGDRLTLLDMNHYTTVKTTMFNGLQHPDIWFVPMQGEPKLLKRFTFEDYRDRMS